MTREQFSGIAKKFATQFIRLATTLPDTAVGKTIGEKLIDAGMNIAFLTRRATLARSKFDFIGKLDDVEKAADTCIFLLEAVADCELADWISVEPLVKEAKFITALIIKTRNNNRIDNDSLLDQVMVDLRD
jgi:hypothetical protein